MHINTNMLILILILDKEFNRINKICKRFLVEFCL